MNLRTDHSRKETSPSQPRKTTTSLSTKGRNVSNVSVNVATTDSDTSVNSASNEADSHSSTSSASNVTPPNDATPSPARKRKRKITETEVFPTTVTNKSVIPPSNTDDQHIVISCDPSLLEEDFKAYCLTADEPPIYLMEHVEPELLK